MARLTVLEYLADKDSASLIDIARIFGVGAFAAVSSEAERAGWSIDLDAVNGRALKRKTWLA